jgi:FkbM family methyltransferase
MIHFFTSLLKTQRAMPRPSLGGGFLGMIARVLQWQCAGRIWPGDVVFDFVSGTALIGRKGLARASGQFYFGFLNWHISPFLLHALRSGERFVDVGANVGVDTVLAAGVSHAYVIACEPSSDTFRYLQRNVQMNALESRVTVLKVAIGEKQGTTYLEVGRDSVNQVASSSSGAGKHEIVQMETVDSVTGEEGADILKIDIVGYEALALRGAERTLQNPRLKAVILSPQRRARDFGLDPLESPQTLSNLGFQPVVYDVVTRQLTPLQSADANNYALLVRDPKEMQKRLSSAEPFQCFDTQF